MVLATTSAQGPPRYRVAKEADLTVVIYENHNRVSANFPLRIGDLTEDRAEDIVDALIRVLPKK